MPLPKKLKSLLRGFAREIERYNKNKKFPNDFFTTTNYNKNSEQHSKILGILAGIAYKQHYFVQIGGGLYWIDPDKKKLKRKKRFTPDLILNKGNAEKIIIEYESTNSADFRIINKDFEHYNSHIKFLLKENQREKIPSFWIEIVTLRNSPVNRKDWYSYAYKNKKKKGYANLIKNPYKHLIPEYIDEIKRFDKKFIKLCPLVLVNINDEKLNVVWPPKFKFERKLT